MSPRKTKFKKKRYQKSKLYRSYPVNVMSDKRFEKGDKDGGYDNWIPFEDKNITVDKNKILNVSNMSVFIPVQGKKRKGEYK